MKREGILVAVRPEVEELTGKLLAGVGLPLVFTHTLADACKHLQRTAFQLAVGTLQFDESRLFDLVPATRAAGTPLVALRMTASQLPENVIDAFFRAVQLSGFHGWLDVYRLTRQHGADEAHRRLHTLIRETALPGG